jgi:hypothetical protein
MEEREEEPKDQKPKQVEGSCNWLIQVIALDPAAQLASDPLHFSSHSGSPAFLPSLPSLR